MTRVEIVAGRLKIEILGWDKLWAFQSRFDIPLENVSEARVLYDVPKFGFGGLRALRAPGTSLPGVIIAGSYYYYREGEWAFWDVHDTKRVIEVRLRNERYAKLILEVEDPPKIVEMIGNSITS